MEPNSNRFVSNNKNDKEYLSSIIKNLYISLNPDSPKNYNLPKYFENLILRIISTNFNVLKSDERIILNSLIEKVNKISKNDIDIINRFQNLYFKLSKKRSLTKRWAVLYLLNYFSKNNIKNLDFSVTNNLQQDFLSFNNILNNENKNVSPEFFFENSNNNNNNIPNINFILSENNNINNRNINSKEKYEYYLNNLFPISDINKIFYENESQITEKNIHPQIPPIYPLVINPSKTSLTITEKDLINDLIYVFEGINGKYISYDLKKDSFVLNKLMPWSEDIYDIVNSLCELGWLYKKIKTHLENFKKEKIKSQFIQSFVYIVQKELDEYFKIISFFKKMSNHKKNYLNLKKLFLWTLEPKEKLKCIATCCETNSNLKGPAIFSQIYSLKNYLGNNSCLNNILNEVSKPFLNFILNWIKYGNLEDPFKEFFVAINEGISDDDIWNLKYQLIAKNVPNFMRRENIIKIFVVGKGIHFIRNYCEENYDLSMLIKKLKNLIDDYDKKENKKHDINNTEINSLNDCYDLINYLFNNSDEDDIMNISLIDLINKNIDLIHLLINEELVKLIFDKFKFISNLESINKYLLLGQGDMMQTLMESLFEELDKPANAILLHNLEYNLNAAIKASNSDLKDSENIKNLKIILLNASQGDIGWDIFCLEYAVKLPLKIIFNNKLLKDYQKIFLFFWKIKRIKYSQINCMWKKIKNLNFNSNKIKNNPLIKKLIHTSIIFNQEIVHFINNLHNYFSLEVLESQFKKLKFDLSQLKNLNLDELIKKHKNFVATIQQQCLLDDENKNIISKIATIFDIILKFKKVFDVLYSFIYEINFENNYNLKRIKNIEEYLKQIDNLYTEYKIKIIELIQIIELTGKNNIKYLAMKLDYNYYYSNIEKEKKDEKDFKDIKNINNENIRQKILADYESQYEQSENSKNNYEENNNIIDDNKFNSEKVNNIKNNININDEEQMNEEDEKIKDEEDNNYQNNINLFEQNEINQEDNNIDNFNENKNENMYNKINKLIYSKKKYGDNNINIIKKEDFQKDNKINKYEDNNSNEDENINNFEINDENNEENNLGEIDDEDKIVTNIIPKVYGISSKGKSKMKKNDDNNQ